MAEQDLMELEDKARINLTLSVRERIIRGLTADNKLPENEEDRNFLMKALDGMDRTVLTKTKIKADDAIAKGQQASAKVVADVLLRMSSNKQTVRNEPLVLEGVPDFVPVEGETHIGVKTFKYDDIMNRE